MKQKTKIISLVSLFISLGANAQYDPSYSKCEPINEGDLLPVYAGDAVCFQSNEQNIHILNVKSDQDMIVTDSNDEWKPLISGNFIASNGLGFHVETNTPSLLHYVNGTVVISDIPIMPQEGTLSRVKRGSQSGTWRSRSGGRVWGGSVFQAHINDQARKNYEAYRERRDRSGDAAARARSSSRSDMNSPGDRGPNDKIGGR